MRRSHLIIAVHSARRKVLRKHIWDIAKSVCDGSDIVLPVTTKEDCYSLGNHLETEKLITSGFLGIMLAWVKNVVVSKDWYYVFTS